MQRRNVGSELSGSTMSEASSSSSSNRWCLALHSVRIHWNTQSVDGGQKKVQGPGYIPTQIALATHVTQIPHTLAWKYTIIEGSWMHHTDSIGYPCYSETPHIPILWHGSIQSLRGRVQSLRGLGCTSTPHHIGSVTRGTKEPTSGVPPPK